MNVSPTDDVSTVKALLGQKLDMPVVRGERGAGRWRQDEAINRHRYDVIQLQEKILRNLISRLHVVMVFDP